MGRLLVFFGFLLTIVGVIAGGVTMMNSISGSVASAVKGPVESEVCQPGESLAEVAGASETIPGEVAPSRRIQYFCVAADGTRRDVTGDYIEDIFGSFISSLPGLGIGLIFMVLPCIGVPMIIVGVILILVRRRPDSVVSYGA